MAHQGTPKALHNASQRLNTSKYFHIIDGLVPEAMHDILEGSLQYEVKELLKHCINTENYFTFDQLQDIK